MTAGWKIFRVANIVEILLVASMFALILYQGNISFKNSSDVIGFSVFCILLLIVICNCTNNILLLRSVASGTDLPFKKKFFFWCMFILFLLIAGLVIWGVVDTYDSFKKLNGVGKPLNPWMLGVLAWMLLIAVNGIYILILQVALFRKIKKNYTKNNSFLITEIGESL